MIKYLKLIFAIIVLSFIISGCYSSKALKYYPDYINKKENISSISLLSDIIIYEDGWEDGRIVNLPLSLEFSDSVLNILENDLIKKGYFVNFVYPPTVGLFKDGDTTKSKIYETIEDYDKDTDSLEIITPPYYLDSLHQELNFRAILEKNGLFYSETKELEETDSSYNSNGEYLFIFSLESNNVSAGKSIGEGLLTALFTLGTVSVYSISATLTSYWLIDIETGETILSDQRYLEGEDTDRDNIREILMDFLKVIPPKYN